MDLLFLTTMNMLGEKDSYITKKELHLVGFNSSFMYALGTMVLTVMVTNSIFMKNFVVIDVRTHYNEILEKP